MFKKIILSLLIIVVLYILAIFIVPTFADNLGKYIGLSKFNEELRIFKGSLDGAPLQDIYNNTLSGANNAIGTVNEVKNNIDDVRGTLNGAVNTYNEVKTEIDQTKAQIENGINGIKTTADTLKGVGFSIENTMSGTLNNN